MGKAAVRSEGGVFHVSMLIRSQPFREWVTVYYDPDKTNPTKLQSLLRARQCPRAARVSSPEGPVEVLNPVLGPGGTVVLRGNGLIATGAKLPPGWKLRQAGATQEQEGGAAPSTLRVIVPDSSKPGRYDLQIKDDAGASHRAAIEIVREVKR